MVDYDSGYKKVFGQPEMVRDLIVGFVKQDWVDKVDFNTLMPVPTERISGALRKRFNDIVWKVKLENEDLYICIMLEFQSEPDPLMPLRILTYLGLLYEHLHETGQLLPTGKLPPVLPIVLYNGKNPWPFTCEMHDLIEHFSDDLAAFAPRLKFLLLDENRFSNAELESPHFKDSRNLAAALFRLEHADGNRAIVEVVIELLAWLDLPRQEPLSRAIAARFNRVFRQSRGRSESGEAIPEFEDLGEVKSMLQETMAEWWDEARRKGREEGELSGLEKGKAEGKAELEAAVLKIALNLKQSGFSTEQIAELTGLSVNDIDTLA